MFQNQIILILSNICFNEINKRIRKFLFFISKNDVVNGLFFVVILQKAKFVDMNISVKFYISPFLFFIDRLSSTHDKRTFSIDNVQVETKRRKKKEKKRINHFLFFFFYIEKKN
jgi:hypothetical protein